MAEALGNYKYRGARAMVLLHETQMRKCLAAWKEAKVRNIQLPETSDADYQSLETLLSHIFRAARGYMVWMCKQLNLPDPEINAVPLLETLEKDADKYLEHILERWRLPLADVEEKAYGPESHLSNWGELFSIDSMLEHAVMHPIRHEFQLRELMAKQNSV